MENYDRELGREVGRHLVHTTPEYIKSWQQGPKQPLDEKQAEIERLRTILAAIRGTLIGAWASGEVDGPDGLSYCKRVLAQIANDVGIQKGESK